MNTLLIREFRGVVPNRHLNDEVHSLLPGAHAQAEASYLFLIGLSSITMKQPFWIKLGAMGLNRTHPKPTGFAPRVLLEI